eukprot:1062514-Amorphochlora_amoeboformis.AAC.1
MNPGDSSKASGVPGLRRGQIEVYWCDIRGDIKEVGEPDDTADHQNARENCLFFEGEGPRARMHGRWMRRAAGGRGVGRGEDGISFTRTESTQLCGSGLL